MTRPGALLKRSLIFTHRWMGVVLALVFIVWFVSGIGMMYWDFPSVTAADRLRHSPVLDPAAIKLSAAEAYAKLNYGRPPDQVRLNTFDGRPVYRFRVARGESIVYADTGLEQIEIPREMISRAAAAWAGLPVTSALVETITEADQWTVQSNFRDLFPLYKFSFPDGQQVYVSENSGEVVQYTTTGSRLGAWVGAIPHWLYFLPLRKHGPEWSQFVIWSSGIGTVASILGMAIGIWMYSPAKRYRFAGQPSSVPYKGQKRWHTIFGLIFGLTATTWAFSGMLSMDPFPRRESGGPVGGRGKAKGAIGQRIPNALRGRIQFAAFDARHPRDAVAAVAGGFKVKELELTSFAGDPIYLASDGERGSRIIPLNGAPFDGFEPQRIMDIVRNAAVPPGLAELRLADEYDLYYLDRTGRKPLPVVYARLNDPDGTRYYIDPKTGRIAGQYSARGWVNRWLYHGLHSLDFPWLYKYRPLWDLVVLTLMIGGTALCVTSLVLAWRVMKKKLAPLHLARAPRPEPVPDIELRAGAGD
jgi:hypothetical protein